MDHSHDCDQVSMALVPNLGQDQRIFSQKYPDSTTTINDLLALPKPKYVPTRSSTPPPFSIARDSHVKQIRQPPLPLNCPPFLRNQQVAFNGQHRNSPYQRPQRELIPPSSPQHQT